MSMKFNGQSSVEVHPHSNLEELKTVTSISLFMRVDPDKDPIEDRLILYLGDRNVRIPRGKIWLLCHLWLSFTIKEGMFFLLPNLKMIPYVSAK